MHDLSAPFLIEIYLTMSHEDLKIKKFELKTFECIIVIFPQNNNRGIQWPNTQRGRSLQVKLN